MRNYFLSFFSYLYFTASLIQPLGATDGIDNTSYVRLGGHVPSKALNNALLIENLSGTEEISVTFVLPLRNQEKLEELVSWIHDSNNKQYYGKYISSEEFIKEFAPTKEHYDKVISYAKNLGLAVTNEHSNRTILNVKGPANTIEDAFSLKLNKYETLKGRSFHAPNKNPLVPQNIASIITGVIGLDNHAEWRAFNKKKRVSGPLHAQDAFPHSFPSGPGGGYSPNDILKAYNLTNVPANGSGQIIALFELAGYQASDINAYTNYFGLPSAQLQNIIVDGGSSTGIDAEVTLDIELALAVAPQSQIYVYEGPNSSQGVLNTYNRIASDNIAKQVSTSWGLAEDLESLQFLQAENAIFLQMAAHGQTIYAAAGDSGAFDDANKSTPVVDDPASQPYVVGVGGTKLTVDPLTGAYVSETVWNEGSGNGAGGGGVSAIWPIPSWQATVSNVYSKTFRNVPDVSLDADPNTGYSIFYNGQWTIYGGTSCAAPLWAGFTALVNQKRVASQTQVLGFANPSIYAIGQNSLYPFDFHDVKSGDNLFYPAKPSYDNATGWGSFNGANLFASLTNSSPVPPPLLAPHLSITMMHNSPFTKGGIGAYQIKVANQGNAPTSGTVSVTVDLPSGLTLRSASGSGWTINNQTLTFTRSSSLIQGSSFPTIVVYVNVSFNAPNSLTPRATVSGGGSVTSTTTNYTTTRY